MIEQIKAEIIVVENFTTTSKEELEQFRLKYLGKKGLLNDFFAAFKAVPNEQKKEFGQTINTFKQKSIGCYSCQLGRYHYRCADGCQRLHEMSLLIKKQNNIPE